MKLRIVSDVAAAPPPHRAASYNFIFIPENLWWIRTWTTWWCMVLLLAGRVCIYTIYMTMHMIELYSTPNICADAHAFAKKIVHIFFIWRWSSFHSCTRAPTFNINKCLTLRVTRAHKSSLHSKRFKCFFPKENIFITFFFY